MKKLLVLLLAALVLTSAASAQLAVGTDLGLPVLRMALNENISGSLGGAYATTGGAATTTAQIKADYNLAAAGKVQPNLGLYVLYNKVGAANAVITYGLTWGVTTKVVENLALGFNVILVNSNNAATATTSVIPAATLAAAYTL